MRPQKVTSKRIKYSEPNPAKGIGAKASQVIEREQVVWVLDRDDARKIARETVRLHNDSHDALVAAFVQVEEASQHLTEEVRESIKQRLAKLSVQKLSEELEALAKRWKLDRRIVLKVDERRTNVAISIPDPVTEELSTFEFDEDEVPPSHFFGPVED